MAKDLLSLDEVASLLKMSRRQVERYLGDNEYKRFKFPRPAATIGRVRVWRRADVTAWKASKQRPPTGRPPKASG